LKEHLNLASLPLANTQEGRDFVMKALHPSDHEVKAARVPGGTDNTLALAIDQVFTYNPSEFSYGGTELNIQLFPNVMRPLVLQHRIAGSGGHEELRLVGGFEPPALGGRGFVTDPMTAAEAMAYYNNVRDNFEVLRITSESVTVNYVAPALSNQGSVVAAQFASAPMHTPMYLAKIQAPGPAKFIGTPWEGTAYAYNYFDIYDPMNKKSQLMSGTRAYTAKAVDGVYLPLRLTDFNWHSVANESCKGRWYCVNPVTNTQQNTPMDVMSTLYDYHPLDLQGELINSDALVLSDMGQTMGHIIFDGQASEGVSYQIRIRMTIEARVRPGSTYAPLCQAPPLPDELALKMYPEIAGRMKNAYPASYNDWDGLKSTIKGIARGILKVADPIIWLVSNGLPMGKPIADLATSATEGLRKWLGPEPKAKSKQAQKSNAVMNRINQILTASAGQSPPGQGRRRRNRRGRGGGTVLPAGTKAIRLPAAARGLTPAQVASLIRYADVD